MVPYERPPSRIISFSQKDLEGKLSHREQIKLSHAVFLDRDGTVNIEQGYITDHNEIELHQDQDLGDVLHTLNLRGYLVIIISNQSAIGRGLMGVEQFEKVNQKLWDRLRQSSAYYNALYYCPHTPEDFPSCDCRKPKPGLILQAALDFHIDLSKSYFVGDKLTDIEAGHRAGCKAILVLTGKGKESQKAEMNKYTTPDSIQDTLSKTLGWILNQQD